MTKVVCYPHFHILYPQLCRRNSPYPSISPLVPGYAELNEFVPAGDEVLTLDVAGATNWEPMEFGSWGSRKWQLNGNMMLETMEFVLTLVVDEPI